MINASGKPVSRRQLLRLRKEEQIELKQFEAEVTRLVKENGDQHLEIKGLRSSNVHLSLTLERQARELGRVKSLLRLYLAKP